MPKKVAERIRFLEKQIKIQQNAVVTSKNEVYIHAALLSRVTDEWCQLVRKYGLPEE